MAPRAKSTRSTSGRGAAASKASAKQSSLTFNNSRITKPNTTLTGKDKKAQVEVEAKAAKLLQEVEDKTSKTQDEAEDEVEEVRLEEDPESEAETKPTSQIPIRTQSEPEALARKVSEAQIRKYWKAKEDERKTPRVHQQDLSLYEKILREFDMSYQYGPCIGITRTRRWNRAHNLGLAPPMEVLAVLLKEEKGQTDRKFERAYMDLLANSRLGVVAQ